MIADELLERWSDYREILGSHEVLRQLGFPAEEIFVFIGLNSAVVLKTQGREFSIAFPELPMPMDEFSAGWETICKGIEEIAQPLLDRCLADWRAKYDLPTMLMVIRSKGIQLPGAGHATTVH